VGRLLLIYYRHPSILCLVDKMRTGHIAWDATQVWERLWLGGLSDAETLAEGNPHCITTVVSLSEIPVENKRRGICYLHLAVEDAEPVPVRQFDAIMDALSENIRWGTVLLHCSLGISRAPSMAAAYMAACGYRGIDAAIKEIRQMRPFISPSNILLNSLKEHLQ
jgi:protein-tyrosine phosphatase